MPILGWGAFTGRQLPTPEMPRIGGHTASGLRDVEHLPPVLRGVQL